MRKKNSVLNIIGTIGAYGISVIFNFITQAIFIRTLGIEYLGLNGLFSNILTMLSVAELGIGSAIIFKLYEPIANKDNEKINLVVRERPVNEDGDDEVEVDNVSYWAGFKWPKP